MSEDNRLTACLDLTRRMPPETVEDTLGDLMFLADDLTEKLLANIEVPFKTEMDTKAGKEFIVTDYNRDGDSYRSPYTNEYYPPLEDGVTPPDNLRKLEVEANEIFEKYLHLYYEGGNSNVYVWETSEGTAACVLFRKEVKSAETNQSGTWNSSHFFRITPGKEGTFNYYLTTSISLILGVKPIDMSGKLVRKFKKENVKGKATKDQVKAMGEMVENAENNVRNSIESVYFGSIKGYVSELRSVPPLRFRAPTRMVLPTGQ